jgi:hypothetical protein
MTWYGAAESFRTSTDPEGNPASGSEACPT